MTADISSSKTTTIKNNYYPNSIKKESKSANSNPSVTNDSKTVTYMVGATLLSAVIALGILGHKNVLKQLKSVKEGVADNIKNVEKNTEKKVEVSVAKDVEEKTAKKVEINIAKDTELNAAKETEINIAKDTEEAEIVCSNLNKESEPIKQQEQVIVKETQDVTDKEHQKILQRAQKEFENEKEINRAIERENAYFKKDLEMRQNTFVDAYNFYEGGAQIKSLLKLNNLNDAILGRSYKIITRKVSGKTMFCVEKADGSIIVPSPNGISIYKPKNKINPNSSITGDTKYKRTAKYMGTINGVVKTHYGQNARRVEVDKKYGEMIITKNGYKYYYNIKNRKLLDVKKLEKDGKPVNLESYKKPKGSGLGTKDDTPEIILVELEGGGTAELYKMPDGRILTPLEFHFPGSARAQMDIECYSRGRALDEWLGINKAKRHTNHESKRETSCKEVEYEYE